MGCRLLLVCVWLFLLVSFTQGFLESSQRWRSRARNVVCASPEKLKDESSSSSSVIAVDTIECLAGPFEPSQLEGSWGRRPVLIRQAFDASQLQADDHWPLESDILQLATIDDDQDDEDVDSSSRLIQHVPGKLDSFELELGPFPESVISQLTEKNDKKWTLVVNDVDRSLPPLADWMDDAFTFLPRWRRDDAQVSLADYQGGIGPHVDSYDVFLIQAAGERTWTVGHDCISVQTELESLVPDLSVRILQQDSSSSNDSTADPKTTEFTLQPGDMLYIPPRFMHCGTAATDNCMTLSVGCRAPSAAELLARVAQVGTESVSSSVVQRYTDMEPDSLVTAAGRSVAAGPTITSGIKESMKGMVRNAVEDLLNDDLEWDALVGKLATEPKRFSDTAIMPYDEVDDPDFLEYWGETPTDVLKRVAGGQGELRRAEGVSFATSVVSSKEGTRLDRLFAFGEMFEVNGETTSTAAAAVFDRIERGHSIRADNLTDISDNLWELLKNLVAEGFLYPCGEDEI